MNQKFEELHRLGQSVWYDNIERKLLVNGELSRMIEDGEIRGVTSNPSIFNKAISKSTDYDERIKELLASGFSTEEIYEHLAIEDIRAAADLFAPLYEKTQGGDGFVSLEVNPYLAYDTDKTVEEALRLWEIVNRPNLMIKIPATKEGLPAITEAIAHGVNVNVTLIFSVERYKEVMGAYLSGLRERLAEGHSVTHVASVASFFVSRIDTNVDKRLQELLASKPELEPKYNSMLGKVAIANAKVAYQEFKKVFLGEEFAVLQNKGAVLQRPLWASTSTKNPTYPDTMYVDNLIGPNTVNTLPPHTLEAFKDHGNVSLTLEHEVQQAINTLKNLAQIGISLEEVTTELEVQGVKAFSDAYTSLLQSIEEKSKALS